GTRPQVILCGAPPHPTWSMDLVSRGVPAPPLKEPPTRAVEHKETIILNAGPIPICEPHMYFPLPN
ncbi:Hypothetical predicted protein, partial [Pelobates cultripes]